MDKETIVAYDQYADLYEEETMGFWDLFPARIINEFGRRVRGKNILDLGSGPGRDAQIYKEKGFNITCVDASATMVAKTQALGLMSYLMDVEALEFRDGSFDGAWAYTSLLHIHKEKLPAVLKKIHAILTPNGIFGLGMIEGDFEGFVEDKNMPGAKRFFAYYEEDELRKLLAEAGFKTVFFERFQPRAHSYLNFICEKV